jgi:hypothetical protein
MIWLLATLLALVALLLYAVIRLWFLLYVLITTVVGIEYMLTGTVPTQDVLRERQKNLGRRGR